MCTPHKVQTNPRYKSFTQNIFTVGDEEQFDRSLPRKKLSLKNINPIANRYNDTIIYDIDIDLSLNLFNDNTVLPSWNILGHNLYSNINSRDVYNTFSYIFDKFKKGIFISVNDEKIEAFVPFSKAVFRNEWYHLVKVDPKKYANVQQLIDKTSTLLGYKPRQKALPLDEWQANDGMFRYEYQQYEGDNNVVTIRDMFQTLCKERTVPDLEFFVNRRDFPILHEQRTEPYKNLYGHRPLISHSYEKYAPIFSCSTDVGSADILIPTYEDWARIQWQKSQKLFPNACRRYPNINLVPWEKKISTAVFRGASTGIGTTILTNQRLKALSISESDENNGRLNVGITAWNLRPRKHISSEYLETIERNSYPKADKLTLQEQANYKYILTLEGHVAAYRLSYELSSGSVILLAESKWKMWYYKFLKPYTHYVPIKEDLSDLLDKIDWCRRNDDKCKKITESALQFYNEYLGERGVLDYLQKLFIEVRRDVGTYSWLPDLLNLSLRFEELSLLSMTTTREENYPFPELPGSRYVGKLDAARTVLLSKKKEDLKFTKTLFKSSNSTIDLIETNGFKVVRKSPINETKRRENIHEAYIGLKSINTLVSKCPNFAYVYGIMNDNEYKLYMEYMPGITLREWLTSPLYNFKDYVSLLLQINLALATAQNYAAFVHYDLYPWNILVQTIQNPILFDYNVGKGIVYSYETNLIPVLIDYGKSRSIVYEKEYGLIDSGFVSPYNSSRSIDTLTILYSTLNVLGEKINLRDFNFLLRYAKEANVAPENADRRHVQYMSKYGILIKFVVENLHRSRFGPLEFINYLQSSTYSDKRLYRSTNRLNFITSRGYPRFESSVMKYGDVNFALADTISKINRQTIPVSSNEITSLIIFNLLSRRIGELDERVKLCGDERIKKNYGIVRKLIFESTPKIKTNLMSLNFPTEDYVYIDDRITPTYLEERVKSVKFNPEDWATVWSICSEAAITDSRLDIFDTKNVDSFDFLERIASNNTILFINHEIEKFMV